MTDAITKAVEALEPFKAMAESWHADEPDTTIMDFHEKGLGGAYIDLGHCRRAAEALAALTALQEQPAPVGVKPLEWSIDRKRHFAYAPFGGRYTIVEYAGMSEPFMLERHGFCSAVTKFYPSLVEAKAAAQADYDRRIISALQPSPAREEAEALVKRLAAYAIHAEYDSPSDVPEFCGWWCEECKEHIEEDGTGHREGCLVHGQPPAALRAET
jgi:hypothetical protein